MNRNRIIALVLAALVLGVTVYAAGGTASDPVVSLSYLQEIFTKKMQGELDASVNALQEYGQTSVDKALTRQLDAQMNAIVAEKVMDRVTQKVVAGGTLSMSNMTRLTLSRGDRLVGQAGTGLVLQSGSAVLYGSATAEILNLTLGGARNPGPAVTARYYYMLTANDGSGVQVTSDSAEFLVRDGAQVIKAYTPVYGSRADVLKELGLFVGTNNGYELERPPTRQEALIMLIRLLGEESTALGHSGTSTFKDLTGWGDGQKYIVYAHNMGYTNGESATTFAQYKYATLEMYLSFTLRALGYSDTAGDFVWNTTSRDLAVSLGLLSQAELDGIGKTGFMRDHVAMISSNALGVPLKGTQQTLGEKLVAAGVITADQLSAAKAKLQ